MSEAQTERKVWTIDAVVRWAADDFRSRGIENPRLDAELIVAYALRCSRTQLILDSQKPLGGAELGVIRELVKRRRVREPIAYLRGEREFYGRPFRVDKRVLIPRPDTETLVEVALARTAHISLGARLLDICTGSGCVGITLARQRPTTRALATDLSPEAVACARENALALGAYNIGFLVSDLFSALEREKHRFDVITGNPPYIAQGEIPTLDADIKDFEPHLALDGGPDGLVLVRRIVDEAPPFLAPRGIVALEIGAGQAGEVASLFESAGYTNVQIARDLGKIERVVSAERPA